MPAALVAPIPIKDSNVRPAYKVSELLALRDSVSDEVVPLDKFGNEEAIKEHVLRPSPSGQLATNRVEKTVSRKRPSPSPSIKRGKVEKLIKEHGSPPGVRVTAAGRVVPTTNSGPGDQLPRGTANSTVHDGGISASVPQFSLLEGFVAYNLQGQLCQVHNGQLNPLEIDTQGLPKYFKFPANTFPLAAQSLHRMLEEPFHYQQLLLRNEPVAIPIKTRIEEVQKEMEEARKTLNQLERQNVFANYKPPEKLVFVTRKKELILRIDSLRKELFKLQELETSGFLTVVGAFSNAHIGTLPPPTAPTPLFPPTVPATISKDSQDADIAKAVKSGFTDTGPSGRESHAIPIIPPKSRLNPASPEFQPPKLAENGVSPSPEQSIEKISGLEDSIPNQSANLAPPKAVSRSEESNKLKKMNQKSSSSSFNTIDFFPTAPEEHSMSRFATTSIVQTPISPMDGLMDMEFSRSELSREERRGYDSAIRFERFEEGHNRSWANGYAIGCYNMLMRFRWQYRALERTHRDMQSILSRMHPRDVTVSSVRLPENARIVPSTSDTPIRTRVPGVSHSAALSPAALPSAHAVMTSQFLSKPSLEPQPGKLEANGPSPSGSTGASLKDSILKNLSSRNSNTRTILTSSIQQPSNDSEIRSNSITPLASPASPRPSPIRSPSRLGRFHLRRSHSSHSNDRHNGGSSPAHNLGTGLGGRLFRSRH